MKDLPDQLNWLKFSSIDWTKDNAGFFYNRYDAPSTQTSGKMEQNAGQETEKLQYNKVYYHRLNTHQDKDVLIYQDTKNPDYNFRATTSYDGKYLILTTQRDSAKINTLSFADLTSNTLSGPISFTPIIGNWLGEFSYIYNVGSQFYLDTNYQAPRGKIVMIDVQYGDYISDPLEHMSIVIPEHPWGVMSGTQVMGGKLIVNYMVKASDRMYIYDFAVPAKFLYRVNLPDIGSINSAHGQYDDPIFLVKTTNFISPGMTYQVDTRNMTTTF